MNMIKTSKKQFPNHRIFACFELHTYSSTDATFLDQYQGVFDDLDQAIVFFDPKALQIKNRPTLGHQTIKNAFGK